MASFRNAYTLNRVGGINKAGGLITTFEDTPHHEDIAAQIIFGGVGAKGRLPVGIGSIYKEGDGVDTEGGLRLKYTMGEETGFNSQSLKKKD